MIARLLRIFRRRASGTRPVPVSAEKSAALEARARERAEWLRQRTAEKAAADAARKARIADARQAALDRWERERRAERAHR